MLVNVPESSVEPPPLINFIFEVPALNVPLFIKSGLAPLVIAIVEAFALSVPFAEILIFRALILYEVPKPFDVSYVASADPVGEIERLLPIVEVPAVTTVSDLDAPEFGLTVRLFPTLKGTPAV